jgi:hypothetical protein
MSILDHLQKSVDCKKLHKDIPLGAQHLSTGSGEVCLQGLYYNNTSVAEALRYAILVNLDAVRESINAFLAKEVANLLEAMEEELQDIKNEVGSNS